MSDDAETGTQTELVTGGDQESEASGRETGATGADAAASLEDKGRDRRRAGRFTLPSDAWEQGGRQAPGRGRLPPFGTPVRELPASLWPWAGDRGWEERRSRRWDRPLGEEPREPGTKFSLPEVGAEVQHLKLQVGEIRAALQELLRRTPANPPADGQQQPPLVQPPVVQAPGPEDQAQQPAVQGQPAPRPPPPGGDGPVEPRERPRGLKLRNLKATFDGDAAKLPYFLTQVVSFMDQWEGEFQSEAEKVRYVSNQLEGDAAQWLVGLYDMGAPELGNLQEFLLALRAQFEDPLRARKARTELKQLKQGTKSVGEYSAEFRRLASQVPEWPEEVKVQFYQEGLNADILEWAMFQGDPETLLGWMRLASEVETLRRSVLMVKHQQSGERKVAGSTGKKGNSTRAGGGHSGESERERRMRKGLCLQCGKSGHRIAECPDRSPRGPASTDKPQRKDERAAPPKTPLKPKSKASARALVATHAAGESSDDPDDSGSYSSEAEPAGNGSSPPY